MSRPARPAGSGPGDADLLRRLRAGDRDALDECYDRFGRPALALARRVLDDDAAAEEVLREAFLAVWRDPGAHDLSDGSVGAWLLGLVHLRAVEAARAGRSARRRPDDGPAGPGAADDGDGVQAALGFLPDAERRALTLAYLAGHTQREVAALTGASLDAVKTAVLSAVRRLRGELGVAPHGGALSRPAVTDGRGR